MSQKAKSAPQFQKAVSEAVHANLQQGLILHQQGKFVEAEHLYEEALQHEPTHFDALHLLGVIALQTGRTQRGVELIMKAIGLNQNVAAAHRNLGLGLREIVFCI